MKRTLEDSLSTHLREMNSNSQNRVILTNRLLNEPELILEVIAIAKDETLEVSGKASRSLLRFKR